MFTDTVASRRLMGTASNVILRTDTINIVIPDGTFTPTILGTNESNTGTEQIILTNNIKTD